MATWDGSGRRPSWPAPWMLLAEREGGSRKLREERFGYRSKTTLSDKIHGRSPWSKADRTIIGFLARRHGIALDSLLETRLSKLQK